MHKQKQQQQRKQIDHAKNLDILMPMYNLLDTAIIIQKHQGVYGNTTEMKQP